ncbi:MAG: phosphate ABC transporter permease subunit PstC [Desulfobacterota bacterium]|nr:phosphate ABC transporter permease subunit PstC [Thermodesulfobacteriota bacterium]
MHISSDRIFKTILALAGISIPALLIAFIVTLLIDSVPAFLRIGSAFFTETTWDPVAQQFGVRAFVVGTILTSCIALVLSIPFSLSIALFLGEYYRTGVWSTLLKSAIELLAGIPSVIYGMWALFVLVPMVRSVQLQLGVPPYGIGIMTASLVLTVMIIPYSASISSDVIAMVPADLKEAALSLGATRYEMLRSVVLPYALSGISAGTLLSLGRALGETMAVTMVIGNANRMPDSIFSPANTMASIIANEFAEATDPVHLASLIKVGLLLMIITMLINAAGTYVIRKKTLNQ